MDEDVAPPATQVIPETPVAARKSVSSDDMDVDVADAQSTVAAPGSDVEMDTSSDSSDSDSDSSDSSSSDDSSSEDDSSDDDSSSEEGEVEEEDAEVPSQPAVPVPTPVPVEVEAKPTAPVAPPTSAVKPSSPVPESQPPSMPTIIASANPEEIQKLVSIQVRDHAFTHTSPRIVTSPTQDKKPTKPFKPYKSPLDSVRSYRNKLPFLETHLDKLKSLTYTPRLDPYRPLCRFETLGGICNDSSCGDQHIRDLKVGGKCNPLRSLLPSSTSFSFHGSTGLFLLHVRL